MRINRRRSASQTTFPKVVYAIVGLVIALMLISAGWTYYNINNILLVTQDRRELALAKGMAVAVSDPIVTRDYAELESRLSDLLYAENLLSAALTDNKGVVLMMLARTSDVSEPVVVFNVPKLVLPTHIERGLLRSKNDHVLTIWYPIHAGSILLGAMRLELSTQIADQILITLRRNLILSVALVFLALLSLIIVLIRHFFKGIEAEETALIASNDVLASSVYVDDLTKLPNRAALISLLERAMGLCHRQGGLLAVCFLDLDGFKQVNDRLGHQAGDALLVEVAKRLRSTVRSDDAVIRLGGDEFVLILGGIQTEQESHYLLRRVVEALNQPFHYENESVLVGASIGVSFYPHDNSVPEVIIKHADQAMYAAKKDGKNRWHFYKPAVIPNSDS